MEAGHRRRIVVNFALRVLAVWLLAFPVWSAPQLSISPFGYRVEQVTQVAGANRTYDVTARAGVANTGDLATNVSARITSSTTGVVVLDGDVSFGNVGRTQVLRPVISADTFKLRFVLPTTYSLQSYWVYAQTVVNSLKWTISCGNCGQNQAPVARAGADQTVYVGQLATLDGSGSSDPDGNALTYRWSIVSKPVGSASALSSTTTVKPTFTPDRDGNYVFQLVVNDGYVDSAPTSVTVTTQNSAPVANTGADQTAVVGTHIYLSGETSTDIDGDALTYQWTIVSKPAGSAAVLLNTDPVSPLTDFIVDKPGTYLIELVVNDGELDSAPDTVIVSTVNSAPIADAGPDQTASLGTVVQLSGADSSDVDGDALSYRWALTAPAGSQAALTTTVGVETNFVVDKHGTYVAQLIVNDGIIDGTADTVTISTINSAPVADAGADVNAYVGDVVTLDGSASNDVDGDPLSYTWALLSQPAGSVVVLDSPFTPATSFVPDVVGLYVAQLVVNDGHVDSAPDTARITIEVQPDRTPPVISISNPEEGSYTSSNPYTVAGNLSEPATLTINGNVATLNEFNQFSLPIALVEGSNTLTFIATDPAGNSATATRHITLDTAAPEAASLDLLQINDPGTGTLTFSGASGTVEPNAKVRVTNVRTGVSVVVTADASGGFTATIAGQPADELEVEVEDQAGNTSETNKKAVPGSALPSDPAAVAPALSTQGFTPFSDSIAFLYSGANPVQFGVTADTMEVERVAVIRGQVTNRAGQPLSGVLVTVKDHDEFGYTRTRADGWFDIAVNGGGYLAVNYERDGYLPVQRQVEVPWNEYSVLDTVVMIPLDTNVTAVLSNAVTVQTHQGAVVTDFRGTRRATLIFPAGTTASMTLPDGTVETLSSLDVRATEYTVGETGLAAMPGELPPTSAYTYAVELSADEAVAAGAKHVSFSKEVSVYVDNFIQFPVGAGVPQAYYDYDKVAWVPEPDGLVIKILSITGGLADIDVMGEDNAASVAELAAIGIDADERRALASLYAAGKTLWRTRVGHFSPWDHNWFVEEENDDDDPPDLDKDDDDRDDKDKIDDECSGCVISPQSQSVREDVGIPGTSISIHYASDRPSGRLSKRTVTASLSGGTIKPALRSLELMVQVAGRKFKRTFSPAPNVRTSIEWDGKDAYGRAAGSQQAVVKIGQEYAYRYRLNPARYSSAVARAQSFGVPVPPSGALTPEQQALYQIPIRTYKRTKSFTRVLHIAAPTNGPAMDWTASVHHLFDPVNKELYEGSGQVRVASNVNAVIKNVAGTGYEGFSSDGSLASYALLRTPSATAVASNGDLYIADKLNYRIRKVSRKTGRISTVAGIGTSGYSGDGGLATAAKIGLASDIALMPDGSLLLAEWSNRIRRISPTGVITTFAGTGAAGFGGDNGPATAAQFDSPTGLAVSSDGTVFVADQLNHRVRRIAPDGTVATLAGNGTAGFSGDGAYASDAQLNSPRGVAVGRDGAVYVADSENNRIRRIAVDGTITTVAGNGVAAFSGDGGKAIEASLDSPFGIAVDARNVLYIADGGSTHRLRLVSQDGVVSTLAGDGTAAFNHDSYPAAAAGLPSPGRASMSPDGSIYVPLPTEHRVVRVEPTLVSGNAGVDTSIPSTDGSEFYEFDNTGKHLRTVDSFTGTTKYSFTYGTTGNLSQIVDAFGNATVFERNASGALQAIVAPHGQRTTIGLDGGNRINAIAYPGGEQHRFTYTSSGLLTSYTDPRGNRTTFTYDEQGHLLTDRNAAGGGWTLDPTLTDLGTDVAATTGEGRTTLFTTTKAGLLGTQGRTQTTTYADGTFTSTYNNPNGRITTTDADGTRIWQDGTPDPRFGMRSPYYRTTSVQLASGLSSLTTRTRSVTLGSATHPLGLTQQIDAVSTAGKTWTTTYDAANLQTSVASPEGRVVSVNEDNSRRPLSTSMADVLPVRFAYDAQGRLSDIRQGIDDPDTTENEERVTGYRYYDSGASAGWLAAITNPLGQELSYEYDSNGRVTRQTMPGGRTVAFTYDANGNLSSLTPPGRSAHVFDYGVLDQMSDYTAPTLDAVSSVTRYAFNLDKQLTRVTRPDGQQLEYSYDAAGKLSILQSPTGNYLYNYSPTTGQMASIAAPSGDVLSYTYDGTLPLSQAWSGSVNGAVEVIYNNDFTVASQTVNGGAVAFSYDRDNLLIGAGTLGINRDGGNGRIVTTAQGAVSTEHYHTEFGEFWGLDVSVDRSGSASAPSDLIRNDLTEIAELMEVIWQLMEDWGADLPERYCGSSLDAARSLAAGLPGNLAAFETPMNNFQNCFESTFEWLVDEDVGPEPARVVALLEEIDDQMFEIEDPNTDNREYVYSEWFDYDQLGRIKTLYDWFEGDTDRRQVDYQYDEGGRLTQVAVNDSNTESYSYDLNGNRVNANGTLATYDAQDRLTAFGSTTYDYTANGELKTKTDGSQATQYIYDVLGNLLSVQLPDGRTISYVIDGQNRRIGKRVNGELTQGFLYQSQLQIAAELDGASNVISRFVYGTKANVPDYMIKGSVTYRIISDHLGSPRLVINADTGVAVQRMDYDSFGNVTHDTNPGFQPFGFAGGLYDDDTKLIRFGARDYDPQVGRWTAKDPILFAGRSLNLYGYVLNDPVNFRDSNGLCGPACAVAAGAIVGGAAGFVGTLIGGGSLGDAVAAIPGGALGGAAAVALAGVEAATLAGTALGIVADIGINLGLSAIDIAGLILPPAPPPANQENKPAQCR